jgi:hypothetical protein
MAFPQRLKSWILWGVEYPVVLLLFLLSFAGIFVGMAAVAGIDAAGEVDTPLIIADFAMGIICGVLGTWLLRRPDSPWPAWITTLVMTALCLVGLGEVNNRQVIMVLLTTPVLVGILATGRLIIVAGFPFLLVGSILLHRGGNIQDIINFPNLFFDSIMFLTIWAVQTRATRLATIEVKLQQEQELRAVINGLNHEFKNGSTGSPVEDPLFRAPTPNQFGRSAGSHVNRG